MKFNSIIVFCLLLPVLLTGCGAAEEPASSEPGPGHTDNVFNLTPEQMIRSGIRLDTPGLRAAGGVLEVSGILDVPPQNRVTISTAFPGFVQISGVLQGSRVEKGQVLAELEHPDFLTVQQDYSEALSQLPFREAERNRMQELVSGNASARRDFEQAQSQLGQLKARIAGLEARLKAMGLSPGAAAANRFSSRISLRSPIGGYVTHVSTNPGAMVQPGQILYQVADTRHLHAEIRVFETDLPALALGQEVEVRIGSEARERHAHVYLIGREVEEDRTVRVHCHFDEDEGLVPGMFLKARVLTDTRRVAAVPEEAVVTSGGRYWIFTAVPGKPGAFEAISLAARPEGKDWFPLTPAEMAAIGGRKVAVEGTFFLLTAWKGGGEEEDSGH
jgi:cobalt-zinc-cadmium efflux system membrane fusion protein